MFLAIPPTLTSDGWIPSPAIMSTTYCTVFLISLTLSTAVVNKLSGTKSGATKKWCIAALLMLCAAKVAFLNNLAVLGISIPNAISIASAEAKV